MVIVAIMGKNKGMWNYFVQWMKDEGVEEAEVFEDSKWIDHRYRESAEAYKLYCRIFEKFTMKHTKKYICDSGQAHRVAISPVSNGKDLLENPQLNYLDFWKRLKQPSLEGEVVCPGPPYEFGNIEWRIGNAPTFGQHTAEVLGECGYSLDAIDALDKEGAVYVAKS